jgi:hypothetical protein
MHGAPQKSPPAFLPPRRPLCRTCDDTGTLGLDACPDCTRNAELRWIGSRAALPIMRRPPGQVEAPNA